VAGNDAAFNETRGGRSEGRQIDGDKFNDELTRFNDRLHAMLAYSTSCEQ